MGQSILARLLAKWRGLLVYYLLFYAFRLVSDVIYYSAEVHWLKWYAIILEVSSGIYCLWTMWRFLSTDEEGDEDWPRLWSR